jgi:hypothetical protein
MTTQTMMPYAHAEWSNAEPAGPGEEKLSPERSTSVRPSSTPKKAATERLTHRITCSAFFMTPSHLQGPRRYVSTHASSGRDDIAVDPETGSPVPRELVTATRTGICGLIAQSRSASR